MGFNKDATFNAGQYSISGSEILSHYWDRADHAYVKCDVDGSSNTLKFHCYGGLSGPHGTYPAKTGRGDHRLAKAICCFNPDEPRTDFGKKKGGRLLLGDCCGIIYGVTGVCHQMANRILSASSAGLMTSAAGYWLSVTAYGPYGSGGMVSGPAGGMAWAAYEVACLSMTGVTATTEEKFMAVEDSSEREFVTAAANLERDHADNPELPAIRLKHLAGHRLGADFTTEKASKMDTLIRLQADFNAAKKPIDEAYLNQTISAPRHASLVNNEYNKFLARCVQLLTPEEYRKLFGAEPGRTVELIDPDIASAIAASAPE